jgi:hypothetical protein
MENPSLIFPRMGKRHQTQVANSPRWPHSRKTHPEDAMADVAKESWDVLRNYESSDLVRSAFKARHGGELNASKAREICTAITQARNYMAAARDAANDIRPLLVYYGVLSMCRGLILFLSQTLRENGLSQAHGLTVKSWGEELAKDTGDVAKLSMSLNIKGTLAQLVEVTERASLLRNNSSKPNFTSTCAALAVDSEIMLIDLLSRIPEARSQMMRWRPERNAVAIWPQEKQADGAVHIRVDAPYTKEDVTAVLGDSVTFVSQQGGVLTYAAPTDLALYCTDCAGPPWDTGTLVALRPMPGGLELSKLAMAYAASYALGMFVRYYPSHWVSMFQNVKHDGALPTLLAVLEHIDLDVPRMVVEFLERRPVQLDEGASG